MLGTGCWVLSTGYGQSSSDWSRRQLTDFGLLITRTRIAHTPAAREVFTHYVRSNVEDF